MLTVACVLSEGPKRAYTRDHVARLSQMVNAHVTQPYRFVCVDDSPFPGWWAKISLFKPGLFTGRVLYLDLDVTVVSSLDQIANHPSSFAAIKDWQRPTINSSVMAWDGGVMDSIYTNFTPSVMDRLAGDQDWISEQMPDAETFPAKWCPSYRQSIRKFGVNAETKVVVFHGFPKPWEVPAVG